MKPGIWRILLFTVALRAFGGAEGTPLERAPERARAMRNPLEGRPDASRAGAKLYSRECASCHGPGGEGIGKAPAIAAPEVRNAPPGVLFWILRNGSVKRGMPSFAHLPEPERWQIVTYLQR